MDKDFHNYVRFKEFKKFVKMFKEGKAYTGTDSSLSSSDVFDEIARELWK